MISCRRPVRTSEVAKKKTLGYLFPYLYWIANYVYNRQCTLNNISPFGILHIHSRFSLQCAGKTVLFTLNTPQFLESSSTYLSSKNEDTTWKQHIHSLSLTTQDEAFKNLIMEKNEGFRHAYTTKTSKQQLEDRLNYDGKI